MDKNQQSNKNDPAYYTVFSLRLPSSLISALKEDADRQGRTVSDLVRTILSEETLGDEKYAIVMLDAETARKFIEIAANGETNLTEAVERIVEREISRKQSEVANMERRAKIRNFQFEECEMRQHGRRLLQAANAKGARR